MCIQKKKKNPKTTARQKSNALKKIFKIFRFKKENIYIKKSLMHLKLQQHRSSVI